MSTLKAIWAKMQALAAKLYSWSPLVVGICIGYFGKPVIGMAIKLAADLVKAILG